MAVIATVSAVAVDVAAAASTVGVGDIEVPWRRDVMPAMVWVLAAVDRNLTWYVSTFSIQESLGRLILLAASGCRKLVKLTTDAGSKTDCWNL